MRRDILRDIMTRFNPEIGHSDNSTVEQDPHHTVYKNLSEDVIEAVYYERPFFKMPPPSSRHAHAFSLEEQAIGVLKEALFKAEARQLRTAFDYLDLSYDESLELLYRFVDFAPPKALQMEDQKRSQLEALLQEQGVPLSAIEGMVQKHQSIKNNLVPPVPLPNVCQTIEQELRWAKDHKDSVSTFGKDALFSLSDKTLEALCGFLLLKLDGSGRSLTKEAQSVQNVYPSVDSFLEDFPMGFMHLDVLSSTLVGYKATHNVPLSLCLADVSLKLCRSQNMDSAWCIRIGWDHKDETGVCANALWGSYASELLGAYVKHLTGKDPLHNVKGGALLHQIYEGLGGKEQESMFAFFGVYAKLAPKDYAIVQEYVKDIVQKTKKDRQDPTLVFQLESFMEKMQLVGLLSSTPVKAAKSARL